MMRIKCRDLVAAALALGLLAACTQGSSQIESAAPLPRPQVVIVQDLAVAPGEVQLDRGISGAVDETLDAGAPPPANAQEVGRQVADAMADKLVTEIRDLRLRAERGRGPTADSDRAAKGIGKQLAAFFSEQG